MLMSYCDFKSQIFKCVLLDEFPKIMSIIIYSTNFLQKYYMHTTHPCKKKKSAIIGKYHNDRIGTNVTVD